MKQCDCGRHPHCIVCGLHTDDPEYQTVGRFGILVHRCPKRVESAVNASAERECPAPPISVGARLAEGFRMLRGESP